MRIGRHVLANALVVAPMAGVTDRPFRQLCKRLGASYAISEMVSADPRLRATAKSRKRTDHAGEVEPIAAQIALVSAFFDDLHEMGERLVYRSRETAEVHALSAGSRSHESRTSRVRE